MNDCRTDDVGTCQLLVLCRELSFAVERLTVLQKDALEVGAHRTLLRSA
jgi:hypothetical protein